MQSIDTLSLLDALCKMPGARHTTDVGGTCLSNRKGCTHLVSSTHPSPRRPTIHASPPAVSAFSNPSELGSLQGHFLCNWVDTRFHSGEFPEGLRIDRIRSLRMLGGSKHRGAACALFADGGGLASAGSGGIFLRRSRIMVTDR
jgi:hypothetical protein